MGYNTKVGTKRNSNCRAEEYWFMSHHESSKFFFLFFPMLRYMFQFHLKEYLITFRTCCRSHGLPSLLSGKEETSGSSPAVHHFTTLHHTPATIKQAHRAKKDVEVEAAERRKKVMMTRKQESDKERDQTGMNLGQCHKSDLTFKMFL